MPVTTLITPEEYLASSFEDLDREFVDGEIIERAMPDLFHSKCQTRWAVIVNDLYLSGHPLWAYSELRLRLRPSLIRISDISIFAGAEPTERFPTHPPLAAIEILSDDDRMSAVMSKLRDYRAFRIPHIWVIDPDARGLFQYAGDSLTEVRQYELPEYGITIPFATIFPDLRSA